MYIAEVDQRMLGANGIGTLGMAVGQIAAVSTGYGAEPRMILRAPVGGLTVGLAPAPWSSPQSARLRSHPRRMGCDHA